jgi:hypothetical protein
MADFYGRSVNQASIANELKVYRQMGKSKADAKKTLMYNLNLSSEEADSALSNYNPELNIQSNNMKFMK